MDALLGKVARPAAVGFLAATILVFSATHVAAQNAMPDFGTITTAPSQTPGAWYTDRYAPAGFSNVGAFEGRTDVLGVEINPVDGQSERPSSFSSPFYNYQGRKYDLGISGDFELIVDLWVDDSWASASGPDDWRAPSMWGTAVNGSGQPTYYPIVGFSNTSGTGMFRGYDGGTGDWIGLGGGVNYGAWNTLGISFDSSTSMFSYFVNGSLEAQRSDVYGTTGLANVIMQSYNFDEATTGHTIHWANTPGTPVPEPSSILLLGTGLFGLAAMRRKREA